MVNAWTGFARSGTGARLSTTLNSRSLRAPEMARWMGERVCAQFAIRQM